MRYARFGKSSPIKGLTAEAVLKPKAQMEL
jgi:hypothetical protein